MNRNTGPSGLNFLDVLDDDGFNAAAEECCVNEVPSPTDDYEPHAWLIFKIINFCGERDFQDIACTPDRWLKSGVVAPFPFCAFWIFHPHRAVNPGAVRHFDLQLFRSAV